MKKLFATMFSLALILSLTVLASCGNKAPNEADMKTVVEKYDANDNLTEADYTVVINYMDAALDEASSLLEEVKDAYASGNESKLKDIEKKGQELEKKYQYMQTAISILDHADEDQMGEANTEKLTKLAEKMQNIGFGF